MKKLWTTKLRVLDHFQKFKISSCIYEAKLYPKPNIQNYWIYLIVTAIQNTIQSDCKCGCNNVIMGK